MPEGADSHNPPSRSHQDLTGVLMWGVTHWPSTFEKVGGLKVLGPAHRLGSYLFLAFLIGHLYLATTGKTSFSLLRAMITGYEEPHLDPKE